MQSCSAYRRRWSSPRQWPISARSATVRLQFRASSSSVGSAGRLIRRRGRAVCGRSSSLDIETRALQVRREVGTGGSRVEGGGVEGVVAQEARELDQLAGIVAQIGQGERVAQG